MSALCCCSTPTDAVVDIHESELELCRETVVVLIAPSNTVENIHSFPRIILVETFVQVVESHTIGYYVSTYRVVEVFTTGRTTSTKFKTITVLTFLTIFGITGMVSPTVINDYWVVGHIKIPVIV